MNNKYEFKVGDKVECIRGHLNYLKKGNVYTIKCIYNLTYLELEETYQTWYQTRFKPAKDKEYDELFI